MGTDQLGNLGLGQIVGDPRSPLRIEAVRQVQQLLGDAAGHVEMMSSDRWRCAAVPMTAASLRQRRWPAAVPGVTATAVRTRASR